MGDTLILEERWYDVATGRIESDWTFVRDAEEETTHSSIRLYQYTDLVGMFEAAGLRSCQGVDEVSGDPFAIGGRLVLVGTKP